MSSSNRPVEVNVDGVIIGSLKLTTHYDEKAEQLQTKVVFEAVLEPEEITALARMSRAAESMTITFTNAQLELPLRA